MGSQHPASAVPSKPLLSKAAAARCLNTSLHFVEAFASQGDLETKQVRTRTYYTRPSVKRLRERLFGPDGD
jgi:hypothetical protein